MKKILLGIGVVVVLVIILFFIGKSVTETNKSGTKKANIKSTTFICKENKTVNTFFFDDKVEIVLNDGRSMLLVQAVSASGARYVNSDESFVFWNKEDTAFIEEKSKITFDGCVVKKDNRESALSVANPASEYCQKVGGMSVIQKRGDGAEYGLCYFEENRACEEWALMRKECPVGGRKTTGFDTIDQKFCAWIGGDTTAVKDSVCTFKNGSQCPTKSLYEGSCLPATLVE